MSDVLTPDRLAAIETAWGGSHPDNTVLTLLRHARALAAQRDAALAELAEARALLEMARADR
jgi:hypothetical protein